MKKSFDPKKAISQNSFAVLCDVNRSTILRMIESKTLTAEPDGKLIPQIYKNAKYIRKHLIKPSRYFKVDEEQRREDFQIINALFTGEKIEAPAEPLNMEKMKICNDSDFYFYLIGPEDEQGDFEPLILCGRLPKKEITIQILPNSEPVTVDVKGGYITQIYLGDYAVTDLYMRLDE